MCAPIILEKKIKFLEKVDLRHMLTAYFIFSDKDLVSGQSFTMDSALGNISWLPPQS